MGAQRRQASGHMNDDQYSQLFGFVAALDERSRDSTLGGISPINDEPVRFRGDSSLAFPASPLGKVTEHGEQTEIKSALFSLLGPIGSLPFAYSEIVSRADRANDDAVREFFDLFNHRSASLMYRAWRKNRMWLEEQSGAPADQQRKFSGMLEGFAGLSMVPARIAWLDFDRDRLLSSADLFPRRVRNTSGLRQLLNRHFQMRFQIEELVGSWESLPDEAKSVFSSTGRKLQLGLNTIIGNRTWQVQSTFNVVIAHPDVDQYRQLRPGSESLRRMQLMIRLYCTPELSFRIRIVVRGDTISPGSLGGGGESGAMLGWNTVAGKPDKNRDYSFSICRDYNESRMAI